MNDNYGINGEGLKKVSLEMINYAQKVKQGFNEIEDVFESSLYTIQGTEKTFLKNYFDTIKTNFSIIYRNLISYANDMNYITSKYQKLDSKSAMIVKKAENKIELPKNIVK